MGEDKPVAAHWFKLAADGDNLNAKVMLGVVYANGEGVAKDYVEAVRLFSEAADAGDVNAQDRLADMLRIDSTDIDFDGLIDWYRQRAERGQAFAQYAVGLAYELGKGVEKDNSESQWWYRAAAKQPRECPNGAFGGKMWIP